MTNNFSRNILIATAFVVLITSLLFFAPSSTPKEILQASLYKSAEAQSPFLFGGPVQVITFCTCSGNWLVYVGPPKMGFFSYYMGTQGYANYNMPFPRYALGIYQPPGLCLMYVGIACSPFGAPSGTITNITGSSI